MLKKQVHCAVLGLFLLSGWTAESMAQELTWAQKMFDKQSHKFGVVARGADARYRFKIKNLYRDPVHISNIRTTCGCTAAKPSKYTLESLEEAYIEVTMDTRKFTQQKDSNLIVSFDAPLYAEVQLPISAYIRTDVVIEDGAVNFGSVDQGQSASKKISIKYAGRAGWKIREIKNPNKHLEIKSVEKLRESGRVEYEIQASLKPTAPAGRFSQEITLVTDDANSPHVPLLVEAKVEADVTVTVAASIGKVEAGSSKNFNVVLRGKKPFSIKNVKCTTDKDAFKIKLPSATRTVHVLPITFTAPEKSGTLSEVFSVEIEGRPEPLIFKTKATVTGGKEASNTVGKDATDEVQAAVKEDSEEDSAATKSAANIELP